MIIPAITVNNISKVYKLYDHPKDRFKETFHPFRKRYGRDFYALKDVSFEIKKGETVGIIGRNGSGKSTLLQIITGVLTPSAGSVQVNGRISALLELGAGFNPEFSGVENVFFNGQIMGFSREEMQTKVDDILAFADIGEFAYQPVKTYSSGMFVRLAFALAINVEPDILIVDEALAVGDAAFQMKCIDRINRMIESGITLLFVSHDPGAVKRLCHRAVLLEKGKKVKVGSPEEVFDLYNAMLADENLKNTIIQQLDNGKVQTVSGTGEARIQEIYFLDNEGKQKDILEVGEEVTLYIKAKANQDLPRLVLGFMIRDRLGQVMFGTNTFYTKQILYDIPVRSEVNFKIKMLMNLGPGDYSITVALTSSEHHLEKNFEWKDFALVFNVTNIRLNIFAGMLYLKTEIKIELK